MGEEPIHPDRLCDVLQGLLPQILVIQAELALHLTVYRVRDADPSPLGEGLEAGGDVREPQSNDVHPVSVDASFFLHHISQADSHAKLHPAVIGQIRILLCQVALHLGRCVHRIQDAVEPGQDVVPGGIHHAAPIATD